LILIKTNSGYCERKMHVYINFIQLTAVTNSLRQQQVHIIMSMA